MAEHWLQICRQFAADNSIPNEIIGVLEAFQPRLNGDLPVLEYSAFGDLEQASLRLLGEHVVSIGDHLSGDVDQAQALMFARRFEAVAAMLRNLSSAVQGARLLRIGLAMRVAEILSGPPRVLRIRAIVDFYYSQAGILHHQERNRAAGIEASALADFFASPGWVKQESGLFHARLQGMTRRGPAHINLLRFDANRFRFKAVDCRRAARRGTPFERFVNAHRASAAVSGGFFLYSETDIEPPASRFDPVGLLVSESRVVSPPVYSRPAFIQDSKGHLHMRTIGLKGVVIRWPSGVRIQIGGLNNRHRRATVPVAFTRAYQSHTPVHPGVSLSFVGQVLSSKSADGPVKIPVGGFVLSLPPHSEWNQLVRLLTEGTMVDYLLPTVHGMSDVVNAMAGGPTLLVDGKRLLPHPPAKEDFVNGAEPSTLAGDETGDRNLLPRLAVGVNKEHQVILAAVDGRNFDRALGFTLKDTARLMKAVGCESAVNMDGGSSKRMVLQGKTLDLASTDIVGSGKGSNEVRPVHTALLAVKR